MTEEVTEAAMTEIETEVVISEEMMIEETGIVDPATVAAEAALPKDRKEWREKLQEAEAERGNET